MYGALSIFLKDGEIDLCGHATLACAYVLFRFYILNAEKVVFSTLSGDLIVKRNGDLLEMEFPAYKLEKIPVTQAMIDAIGATPSEAYHIWEEIYCACLMTKKQ